MKRLVQLALVTALILEAGSWAAAQEAVHRRGFWWGAGFSYGSAWVTCDICAGGRGAGFSATAVVGGTLGSALRVGAEGSGWLSGEAEVDEYLGALSGVVYWYPKPSGGFYLKVGVGYLAYRIDDSENALSSSGLGPQLGAGYEVRVGRRGSVQPYMNAMITLPTGQLQFNGDRQADGVGLALFQLGISYTWH